MTETKKQTTKKVTKKTTTKKTTAKGSTTKKTSSKKKDSLVPEFKQKVEEIIPNAYGLDKLKDWTESAKEVKCTAILIKVKSSAGKHLHDFQLKLYLRELAEKEGFCLSNLELHDDYFQFILQKPINLKEADIVIEEKK